MNAEDLNYLIHGNVCAFSPRGFNFVLYVRSYVVYGRSGSFFDILCFQYFNAPRTSISIAIVLLLNTKSLC